MHPTASSLLLGMMAPCLLLKAEVLCQHRAQRWAFRNEKVPKGNTGADKDLPQRPLRALGKEARGGGIGRLSQLSLEARRPDLEEGKEQVRNKSDLEKEKGKHKNKNTNPK